MSSQDVENDVITQLREKCLAMYYDEEQIVQQKVDEFYDEAFEEKYNKLEEKSNHYDSKIAKFERIYIYICIS